MLLILYLYIDVCIHTTFDWMLAFNINVCSYSDPPTGTVTPWLQSRKCFNQHISSRNGQSMHIETLPQRLCLMTAICFGFAMRRHRGYAHLRARLVRAY